MAKARRIRSFNVKVFLSTVDGGRTVASYLRDQKVYSQGDPADAVFYILSQFSCFHVWRISR